MWGIFQDWPILGVLGEEKGVLGRKIEFWEKKKSSFRKEDGVLGEENGVLGGKKWSFRKENRVLGRKMGFWERKLEFWEGKSMFLAGSWLLKCRFGFFSSPKKSWKKKFFETTAAIGET